MELLPQRRTLIATVDFDTVRARAAEAEANGYLHADQVATIYKNKWFKMFVPQAYGGLDLDLPDALRLEEALAWVDGSTAWVVTLCSGAGWFAGFLDHKLAEEIFSTEQACIAGSGAPTGTAEQIEGGYRIKGEWRYASGASIATMFTANCVLTSNGVARTDSHGNPLIRSFIFYSSEVEIVHNWRSMGMIATGSHGFRITDLIVPAERAFLIDAEHATLANRVYQYPFLQLAESTLAVNYAGLALRFIDLCRNRKAGHSNATSEELENARLRFFQAVETSWSFCSHGEAIPSTVLSRVSESSYQVYKTALATVNNLYRSTGLEGADKTTELNRIWRNMYTASQHALFAARN